jgi:hypothetical protein
VLETCFGTRRSREKQNQRAFFRFLYRPISSGEKKTLEDFQTLEDNWLYIETDFWDSKRANNYFKWFHVLEDEINHRGQIQFLRQRIS